MDCNEVRQWIDANVDGELDVRHHEELQAHLRGCLACRSLAENRRVRKIQLASLGRFHAPAGLDSRIRAALASEPAGNLIPLNTVEGARVATTLKSIRWQAIGLAASIAVAAFIGFSWGHAHAIQQQFVGALIGNHVRSLQAEHLTDVASTDRHTVKPWFAGKLDFSPPVIDLAGDGFPLVGGRLDRLNEQTVAALVYRRGKHALNLFVWPANADKLGADRAQHDGYNVVAWSSSGFNFVAVSEIPADELETFARTFRAKAN
jgi:anti-sigma factor RsiW